MSYKLDLGLGVKVVQSDVKKAESQLDSLYKKYNGKSINLNVGGQSLSKSSKNFKTLDTNIQGITKSAKDSAKVFEQYYKQLDNAKIQNVTAYNKEYNKSLDKVNKSAKDSAKVFEEHFKQQEKLSNSTKKINTNTKKLNTNTKELTKSTTTFGSELAKNTSKFISWNIITTSYFAALAGLKQIFDEVVNLNSAMLELSKVTDLSSQEMDLFAKKAEEIGKTVNATTADVVRASADFARMGFSPEVSKQLASDAIVLTKIADGITEVSEASTSMIAILRGFNLEAQDSEHIINAINEVSNNFAINTDSLADGLRRVGGVMSQSNTSLEETIGLLTAGQEGLQNIEKVSAGLEIN